MWLALSLLWLCYCCGAGSIPGLAISTCPRNDQKKKKERNLESLESHGDSGEKGVRRPTCKALALALTMVTPSSKGANNNKKQEFLCRGAAEMNPIRNHEVAGSILGLSQWVKDLVLL